MTIPKVHRLQDGMASNTRITTRLKFLKDGTLRRVPRKTHVIVYHTGKAACGAFSWRTGSTRVGIDTPLVWFDDSGPNPTCQKCLKEFYDANVIYSFGPPIMCDYVIKPALKHLIAVIS